MNAKITGLAVLCAAVLCLIASGCHAPLHRAPKNPVAQTAATAKTQSTPCSPSSVFLASLKAKHPDLTNLLSAQMGPVAITGANVNHYVALFNASPAAAPTAAPSPAASPGSGDPASASPSPSPSPSPTVNAPAPLMFASEFVDPSSCAIDGYEEVAVSDNLIQALPSCTAPEKALGAAGALKQFATITYGDSFKSPFDAEMGVSAIEVYSLSIADDGTKSVYQYFFVPGSCDGWPREVTPLTDPTVTPAPSPSPSLSSPKKSGS